MFSSINEIITETKAVICGINVNCINDIILDKEISVIISARKTNQITTKFRTVWI